MSSADDGFPALLALLRSCHTKKHESAAVIVAVNTMSKLAARAKAIAPRLDRNTNALHLPSPVCIVESSAVEVANRSTDVPSHQTKPAVTNPHRAGPNRAAYSFTPNTR